MSALKILKYVRAILTIVVISAGALILATNSTEASLAGEAQESLRPDRREEVAECKKPENREHCFYTYCLAEGSECSLDMGSCTDAEGNTCPDD